MNINDLIKTIASKNQTIILRIGKVISVDETASTCDIQLDDELMLYDVKIKSIVDGSNMGITIIPKKESIVIIGSIENIPENAVILVYSQIEKIYIKNEQMSIEMSDKIKFNGGNYGGIVKIQALEQNLQQIKTYCEVLTASVVAAINGMASGAGTGIQTATDAVKIHFINMENTNILHG